MLIHGDNLLALKALEGKYAGMVKCIYIDPPYNADAAQIYEDNIEHSLWLTLIRPRLQILRSLLCKDGSIWISIDNNERDYLKVLCDELFGRSNFVASIVLKAGSNISKFGALIVENSDWIEKNLFKEYIEKATHSGENLNIVKKNDVLIASTGDGTLGKACVYDADYPAIADGYVTII